jgi:hypothetical protein
MSAAESLFLKRHISQEHVVLEYGSGSSTKEIAKLCHSIVSVEHNPEWFNTVINDLPKNANLLLREPDLPYAEGGDDGTYEQFKNYITAPLTQGPFDIILIDGRARIECAKFVKNVSKSDTMVFIHDFTSRLENHSYKEIFSYLTLIESVEDISRFNIKF